MNNDSRDETLNIMTYTMNSGIKGTVPMSSKQLEEWIGAFKKRECYIMNVGNEVVGLNALYIVDFKIHGKTSTYYNYLSSVSQNSHNANRSEEDLPGEYIKRKKEFRIECKCGESYSVDLPSYSTKTTCNKCYRTVFLDKSRPGFKVDQGIAPIMTNRYYVERFR